MVLPLIAAAARGAIGLAGGAIGGGMLGKAVGALGGPLGATAIAADVVPLLTDLFSTPQVDQAKVDKVKQVRDAMAARMAASEGIPIAKATEMINEQMKPLIDEASQPQGGVTGGKTLVDAGALGLTAALALRGKKGAGMKPAAAADENFNYHEPDVGEMPQRPSAPSVPFAGGEDPRSEAAMQMLSPMMEPPPVMPQELPLGGGLDAANRSIMPSGLGTRGMKKPKRGA